MKRIIFILTILAFLCSPAMAGQMDLTTMIPSPINIVLSMILEDTPGIIIGNACTTPGEIVLSGEVLLRCNSNSKWGPVNSVWTYNVAGEYMYPTGSAYIMLGSEDPPDFMLHLKSEGSILAQGGDSDPQLLNSLFGTILFWYTRKAAFRAGEVGAGGEWDDANIGQWSVAFGLNNKASGAYSMALGGNGNQALGSRDMVLGGTGNIASTLISGGGYATVIGGQGNSAENAYAFIGGGDLNTASNAYSTIVGGTGHNVAGFAAFIGGGSGNEAQADYSTVSGGSGNIASGGYTTIGGGQNNRAIEIGTTVAGGNDNQANDEYATVAGGANNRANAMFDFVGGGLRNVATGGTIAGGQDNTVNGGGVFTGTNNQATGAYIFSGVNHTANNSCAIFTGDTDFCSGMHSIVLSGVSNAISNSNRSTIINGNTNEILNASSDSIILNGNNNSVTGANIITGGIGNQITKDRSIVFGQNNTVTAGSDHFVFGASNIVNGGSGNFIIGNNVTASSTNAVIIAPHTGYGVTNTADNDVIVAPLGYVGIKTSNPQAALHVNGTARVENELNVAGTFTLENQGEDGLPGECTEGQFAYDTVGAWALCVCDNVSVWWKVAGGGDCK